MVGLVAVDLDDTLIDGAEALSPATSSALRELEASGVAWCVATGRATGRVGHLGLEPSAGWICAHGGRSWTYSSWAESWEYLAALKGSTLAGLLALIDDCLPGARVGGDIEDTLIAGPGYPLPQRPGRKIQEVSFSELAECELDMVRIHHPHAHSLVEYVASAGLDVNVWKIGSSGSYAEVTASGATKAEALEKLAAHWGLDMSQVAAIGDGHSDVPMLAAVGLGVAMPGSHPEALAAADVVASHGIAAALRDIARTSN